MDANSIATSQNPKSDQTPDRYTSRQIENIDRQDAKKERAIALSWLVKNN
jgi:hypothetical protein